MFYDFGTSLGYYELHLSEKTVRKVNPLGTYACWPFRVFHFFGVVSIRNETPIDMVHFSEGPGDLIT